MKHNPFSAFNPQDRFLAYLVVSIILAITLVGAVVLGLNIQQKMRDPNYLASKHSGAATANDGNSLIPVAVVNPNTTSATNASATSLEPLSN